VKFLYDSRKNLCSKGVHRCIINDCLYLLKHRLWLKLLPARKHWLTRMSPVQKSPSPLQLPGPHVSGRTSSSLFACRWGLHCMHGVCLCLSEPPLSYEHASVALVLSLLDACRLPLLSCLRKRERAPVANPETDREGFAAPASFESSATFSSFDFWFDLVALVWSLV
jgi:hypothetical protein